MTPPKKLRLLKVVVQPTFVLDDGKTLTEVSAEPVVVQPDDWPTYATGRFAESVAAYEAQVNTPAQENGQPPITKKQRADRARSKHSAG